LNYGFDPASTAGSYTGSFTGTYVASPEGHYKDIPPDIAAEMRRIIEAPAPVAIKPNRKARRANAAKARKLAKKQINAT